MRTALYLVIALRLSACLLFAQDAQYATNSPTLSAPEQEVLNVSLARRDAHNRRDVAALRRYIAEDCLFSDDDGIVRTKAQYLETMSRLPVGYDHSTDVRDIAVRLHGNVAVINFRTTAHEQFTDSDIISEQRRTETWLRQDGAWVLIAMQWGNLPVNFRKPVTVDTSIYKDYVGQYEWRPGDHLETVFVKDGKLWSQLDGEEDEYLPAARDTFFVKSDLGTSVFIRDSRGHVTGYTYQRNDGQEVHVKKIK